MSSEVEITVRVMTPRHKQDPWYTAEKINLVGELSDPKFQGELLRDFHVLTSRATNYVMAQVLQQRMAATDVAREADAAEHRLETER